MEEKKNAAIAAHEQEIAKKAADGVSPFYVRKKRFFEK